MLLLEDEIPAPVWERLEPMITRKVSLLAGLRLCKYTLHFMHMAKKRCKLNLISSQYWRLIVTEVQKGKAFISQDVYFHEVNVSQNKLKCQKINKFNLWIQFYTTLLSAMYIGIMFIFHWGSCLTFLLKTIMSCQYFRQSQ